MAFRTCGFTHVHGEKGAIQVQFCPVYGHGERCSIHENPRSRRHVCLKFETGSIEPGGLRSPPVRINRRPARCFAFESFWSGIRFIPERLLHRIPKRGVRHDQFGIFLQVVDVIENRSPQFCPPGPIAGAGQAQGPERPGRVDASTSRAASGFRPWSQHNCRRRP